MRLLVFLLTSLTAYGATDAQLIEKAQEAQKRAYAPYSNYKVGAALVTKSGTLYQGCNVENASYGLCNCAERTAVFTAVAAEDHAIEAIAVCTRDGGMPCGGCRQVLNEFNPKMRVIATDEKGNVHLNTTLDKLLPHSFGPQNLD